MSDMDYIIGKLRELAEQGTADILKALMHKQSEATLAGALGDERSLMLLQETLRDVYRAMLERMAKFIVGMNAETSDGVLSEWTAIAQSVGEDIVSKKANSLFGNPPFDRQARSRANRDGPKLLSSLEAVRTQAVADARNRVVGDAVIPRSTAGTGIPDAVPGLVHAMEKLKVGEADTKPLSSLSHQDLVEIVKAFVADYTAHTGIAAGSKTTQGLSDCGTDVLASCLDGKHRLNVGFQVKSNDEIKRVSKDSTQRTINAQITESRRHKLDHLIVVLGGDMTDRSVNAKCRAILSGLHGDDYVIVVEPETMAGLAAWMDARRRKS